MRWILKMCLSRWQCFPLNDLVFSCSLLVAPKLSRSSHTCTGAGKCSTVMTSKNHITTSDLHSPNVSVGGANPLTIWFILLFFPPLKKKNDTKETQRQFSRAVSVSLWFLVFFFFFTWLNSRQASFNVSLAWLVEVSLLASQFGAFCPFYRHLLSENGDEVAPAMVYSKRHWLLPHVLLHSFSGLLRFLLLVGVSRISVSGGGGGCDASADRRQQTAALLLDLSLSITDNERPRRPCASIHCAPLILLLPPTSPVPQVFFF